MAPPSKKNPEAKSSSGFQLFDDKEAPVAGDEEELPRDEAGRRKIKQQYVDLLGIRVEKLKGRILNRERINKTLEGIYFICARCAKICHNLDEGLVEDDENEKNRCTSCSQTAAAVKTARAAKVARDAKTAKAAKSAKIAKKAPAKKSPAKKPASKAKTTKKASKAKR